MQKTKNIGRQAASKTSEHNEVCLRRSTLLQQQIT